MRLRAVKFEAGVVARPPVLLLHGAGLSATSWYLTVGALGQHHRIIAADLVFDRGLGEQSAVVGGEEDAALWVVDLPDGLGVATASLVGLSQPLSVGLQTAESASHIPRDGNRTR